MEKYKKYPYYYDKPNKKVLKSSYKINNLFKNKEDPKKVIKYIYRNVYNLIDQLNYLPDNLYFELVQNYSNYYEEIIKNTEEIWLKTLFPQVINSFNFKEFYQGLVGRLVFFSEKFFLCTYWYGDFSNWLVSYKLDLIDEDNDVSITRCKFLVIDNYCESVIHEWMGTETNAVYQFILYKKELRTERWYNWYKNLSKKQQDIKIVDYERYDYKEMEYKTIAQYGMTQKQLDECITQYKKNIEDKGTEGYNILIGKAWYNIWFSKAKHCWYKNNQQINEIYKDLIKELNLVKKNLKNDN